MKPRILSTARLSFPLASALTALLAVQSASALNYFWDNNGTTSGFGTAAGTWAAPTTGSATQGWSTSTTGVLLPGSVTTAATDTVNFGNGATGLATGSIAVSGTVNTGNMTFATGSGAITLTGGTISLASGSSITAINDGNIINSAISLAGAGTIALGRDSGVTGNLTVGGRISGGTGMTFTTSSGNSGNFLQTILLNAASTYGGNTTITTSSANVGNTMTVKAGIANALPTGTVLTIDGGTGSGSGGRTTTYDLGGFSQTLAGLQNVNGLVRRQQRVTNTGALATLTINNTANYSFGGTVNSGIIVTSQITGAIALTKEGGGTFTLTGADHTYTGATTVNGGTLDLGGSAASGALTASTVLNLSGGTLSYTRTGTNTQSFTTTNINAGASAVTTSLATQTIALGNLVRTVAGGTVNFSSSGTTTTSTALTNNILGGWGTTNNDSWATKTGANITALGTYTATTNVAADYLNNNMEVDAASTLTGAGIISANSLRFSGGSVKTLTLDAGNNIILSGGILVTSDVADNLQTITGGNLTGSASRDLIVHQHNINNGLTISSVINNNVGATALTKAGAGLLTLNANNTFTGGLFVNGGQVLLNNLGALNNTAGSENAVTFAGNSNGILTLNGNSLIVRSLSGNTLTGPAIVENASAGPVTLTVGNSLNLASNFGGIIRDGTGGGALVLTKAGTGTLTLSGNNSYSGGTAINAGKILASHSNALGSGNVTMGGSSAGLQLRLSEGVNISNPITMNGGSTSGEGVINAMGNATYSGNITINSNALNGGGHFAASGSNNLELSGVITSSVNVVQRLGSVTYSGGGTGYTNLDVTGSAKVGALNGIATTATVSIGVSAAGTLDLNGFNQSLVGINKNNATHAATIASSSSTADSVLTITGTSTFAGTIVNAVSGGSRTVALTVNGGNLTLSGNNSYTGATTVSSNAILSITGGYLSLTTPINIESGSLLTTSRNNTFSGGGNGQPSGAWTIAGTLTQTANGSTMPLSVTLNNGTMSGTQAVNAFGSFLSNGGAGTTITANGASNAINAVGNVGLVSGLTIATPLVGDALAISSQLGGTSANAGGLTKTGLGTATLSGTNTYAGVTTVSAGSLIINGAVASTSLVVNGNLRGNGVMANATLSGSGSINPGNSPGIMAAAATDPTGGLDYNFEFTQANTAPTWSNTAASVNDVLRLTNVSAPFSASLNNVGNTVNIYLNVGSFLLGDTFTGGFYTDNNAAFLASISGAAFQYYVPDLLGTEYNGINYSLYSGSLDFSVATVQVASADFAGGTITNGYVSQFTVIPEPRAALLGGLGLLALLRRRRN